jgi:Fe-S-cluster-containing hydrogenase component 2
VVASKKFGIVFDPARCTGCRLCEQACVDAHPEDIVKEPRIRIEFNATTNAYAARYCVQCDECAPSAVCPSDLIWFEPKAKTWILEEERCIACDACIPKCDYKAIFIDHTLGIETAYKCDMCINAGGPKCIPACPSSALSIGVEEIEKVRGNEV